MIIGVHNNLRGDVMKRQLILVIVLIVFILIAGCQPTIGVEENINKVSTDAKQLLPTIGDFYPFMENTIFEYAGIGNEYGEQKTYFEFVEVNRGQLKIINPGTNIVKIVENDNGELREVFFEGEFYHIENILKSKATYNNILLKEPLTIGNSWLSAEGYTREITGLDIDIETPYKLFNALEVTTRLDNERIYKDYYVKGLGHVARIYNDGKYEVKTLLKSIKNQPLQIDIEVFYPLYYDIGTVYLGKKIDFYSNQSVEKVFEDIFKNPPTNELLPVISIRTIINSIYLDRSSWVVKVDFSKELIEDFNGGSSLEGEVLKSIVNTLGKFYDTESVYITVEGRPYKSGHYELREEEGFKVDTEGLEKFNK